MDVLNSEGIRKTVARESLLRMKRCVGQEFVSGGWSCIIISGGWEGRIEDDQTAGTVEGLNIPSHVLVSVDATSSDFLYEQSIMAPRGVGSGSPIALVPKSCDKDLRYGRRGRFPQSAYRPSKALSLIAASGLHGCLVASCLYLATNQTYA